ncbi:KR domain-containing protein [Cercophora newfieldiana]|uniref:KR domain-containing protein n=1 Tax=Cercophora newfieldiana TaxID=92897 RepID=A0AA39YEG0_9PEZI|nr:KR domain-containing protein [Cercophora newfieldiana]
MAAMQPKIAGTWNLNSAFLDAPPLDIFWLASSTVTAVDQPGQGSYKAGCVFLESFCQYRHSLGLPASVLSICPIEDVGFVAENAFAKRNTIAQGNYMLGEREFPECVEASLLGQWLHQQSQFEGGQGDMWQSKGHIIMHGSTVQLRSSPR